MFSKNRFDFIVPAAVVLVFAVLALAGPTRGLDQRIYDLFLHLKPTLREEPSILLLDVDDFAISRVGSWPWSRDVMGDGLILMREFGAARAVFDIEYVNKSPRGLDTFLLHRSLPDAFNAEFAQIQTNIEQLFNAIRTGILPAGEARKYVSELVGLTAMGKSKLLEAVQAIEKDNDAYLGQAARFFGAAYFTVNSPDDEPDQNATPEMEKYAMETFAVEVDAARGSARAAASLMPVIPSVALGAAGAGFPNVVVDADGVRRRIDLIKSFEGRYFAQLAFRPLLDSLGNPAVTLKGGSIVLKGADVPGKGVRDIAIPLDADGRMLINWLPEKYIDSFSPHLSFYELVYHKQLEDDLQYNLSLMDQSGYFSYFKGESRPLDINAFCADLKKSMLESGDLSAMEDYIKARSSYFDSVGQFLNGDAEKAMLNDIEKALSGSGLTAAEKKNVQEVKAQVPKTFSDTRGIYDNLVTTRKILAERLPGAFCIVGVTATSTTDIGVNPFVGEYVNVGTHASVVNTIVQGAFLDQSPWWFGAILALALSLIATAAIIRLDAMRSLVVGSAAVLVLIGFLILYFRFTGVYLGAVSPVASVFFTFIALTAVKFLRSEREKSFVRNAWGHYLSTDVINDLIANPEKLDLGGDKKVLTAMFTDVKGFSTFSEVLDPVDLVRLLNHYLTEMSDIIMDMRGTIDKYEGDAIISFFGAPLDLPDHPRRACLAAVTMKRAEIVMNERFIAEKLAPTPLQTRIGINTGEMTVGNMGTLKRMDYTIMGNSVNLAARLEGVNKQYGTWILISQAVHDACGDGFLMRKLDPVRVIGINKPVRLYELIDEKGKAEDSVEKAVEIFHEGLDAFEAKNWSKAEKIFTQALKISPDDGPSQSFLKRCREYKAKPPAEGWDGVFNLTTK
jgi:adenylate cyclase